MLFSVNQEFNYNYSISGEVFDFFQKCSKDFNPLHTDTDFAIKKGFPERVMYGNILNAFLSHFIGEGLPTKNVIIHSQSIVYRNPVFMNETLEFKAIVSDIFEAVNTVEFKFKFIKPNGKIAAKGVIQIGVI